MLSWHLPVFVFYCCFKSYHKPSNSKSHIFIISQFPWIKSPGTTYLGPLLRISRGCNQGVSQAVFSSKGFSGEESPFKLIQMLTVCQGLLSALRGPYSFSPCGLLHSCSYNIVAYSFEPTGKVSLAPIG